MDAMEKKLDIIGARLGRWNRPRRKQTKWVGGALGRDDRFWKGSRSPALF